MKTLITYATKYGCAENCAKALEEKLSGNVNLQNLKQGKAVDLLAYDQVIIGGSIYMGKIQKEVTEFCLKNLTALKEKQVGLFICCMKEGEEAASELNSAFPQELLDHAAAKEIFGGEFIFKKMKPMDRFIVKKVSKVDRDVSNIDRDSIERFARVMNQA